MSVAKRPYTALWKVTKGTTMFLSSWILLCLLLLHHFDSSCSFSSSPRFQHGRLTRCHRDVKFTTTTTTTTTTKTASFTSSALHASSPIPRWTFRIGPEARKRLLSLVSNPFQDRKQQQPPWRVKNNSVETQPQDLIYSGTANHTMTSALTSDALASQQDVAMDSAASSTSTSTLPSYRTLIVFTITTILIWLSEPLLSLVDTTIVGWTCDPRAAVVQIAALGPATMLYDSAIYVTYFLAVATTNQVAPALAKKQWRELRRLTSHLMGSAVVIGAFVTAICWFLGRSLITSMVGTIANTEIIPLATTYSYIRATVAPFCVLGFVAQSFCLACLDVTTPAIAVIVSSFVNVIGDLVLTTFWGIQGAAIATALATVSSCLILVNKVQKTITDWKRMENQEKDAFITQPTAALTPAEDVNSSPSANKQAVNATTVLKRTTPTSSSWNVTNTDDIPIRNPHNTSSESSSFSKSALAAPNKQANTEREKDIPFLSLPDRKSFVELIQLGGPIFLVMMAKICCYSLMTLRATNFGIVPLAAQNIMMRIFFFYACFGDSLSQAAQSYYPAVNRQERGRLLKRLLYLCTWMGIWNSQIASIIIKQFGGILTKDASILHTMASHTKYLGLSVLLHPFIMLFEGTVLAKRDLTFMVATYAFVGALHFGFVFSPYTNTFQELWRALFIFQITRLIQFGGRVWKERNSDGALVDPAEVTK